MTFPGAPDTFLSVIDAELLYALALIPVAPTARVATAITEAAIFYNLFDIAMSSLK